MEFDPETLYAVLQDIPALTLFWFVFWRPTITNLKKHVEKVEHDVSQIQLSLLDFEKERRKSQNGRDDTPTLGRKVL